MSDMTDKKPARKRVTKKAARKRAVKDKPLRNLTDHFDRVFLINCQHRPDRLEETMAEFKRSGMADPSKVIVTKAIVGDYTGHSAGWGAGNGAWGCLQSHRRILEDLLHMRDERDALAWTSALILEDDVFFLDNALEDFNRFIADAPPEWGQLYLGGQHQQKVTPTDNPNLKKGNSINRTHAYAVHQSSVKQIYQHISYMPDYGPGIHVDHQLELAHRRKDWPVYCPARWICGQRAGTSNISGADLKALTWL